MKNKQKKKKKYTFESHPSLTKLRVHKSSFEKIKISIKSQEDIFPPFKQLLKTYSTSGVGMPRCNSESRVTPD